MPPPNPRSGPLNTFKLQGVKRLIECAADRHDQIFYYLLFIYYFIIYYLLFIIYYLLLFYYLLFIIYYLLLFIIYYLL